MPLAEVKGQRESRVDATAARKAFTLTHPPPPSLTPSPTLRVKLKPLTLRRDCRHALGIKFDSVPETV